MGEYLAFKIWNVDGQSILKVVTLTTEENREAYMKENKGYQAVDSLLVQQDRPKK